MWQLAAQVLDFIFKSCLSYAGTPQGQQELRDIERAAEGTPFDFTPEDETVPPFSSEATPQRGPASSVPRV